VIDKIAAPFWLCWSAGLVIALATGDFGLWLSIGAATGLALGLILRARAVRKRLANLRRPTTRVALSLATPSPPPARPSGVDLDPAA
jgi:hypothetical protein